MTSMDAGPDEREFWLGPHLSRHLRVPGPGRLRSAPLASIASSAQRFSVALNRPGPTRRLLRGPSVVTVPTYRSAATAPPRWWAPDLVPSVPGEPEQRPAPAADPAWTAVVTSTDLPDRGLPRAVHQVPDEKSWTPGGILANLAPALVPVRRLDATKAAGPMLTSHDRARLSAAIAGAAPTTPPPPSARPAAPARVTPPPATPPRATPPPASPPPATPPPAAPPATGVEPPAQSGARVSPPAPGPTSPDRSVRTTDRPADEAIGAGSPDGPEAAPGPPVARWQPARSSRLAARAPGRSTGGTAVVDPAGTTLLLPATELATHRIRPRRLGRGAHGLRRAAGTGTPLRPATDAARAPAGPAGVPTLMPSRTPTAGPPTTAPHSPPPPSGTLAAGIPLPSTTSRSTDDVAATRAPSVAGASAVAGTPANTSATAATTGTSSGTNAPAAIATGTGVTGTAPAESTASAPSGPGAPSYGLPMTLAAGITAAASAAAEIRPSLRTTLLPAVAPSGWVPLPARPAATGSTTSSTPAPPAGPGNGVTGSTSNTGTGTGTGTGSPASPARSTDTAAPAHHPVPTAASAMAMADVLAIARPLASAAGHTLAAGPSDGGGVSVGSLGSAFGAPQPIRPATTAGTAALAPPAGAAPDAPARRSGLLGAAFDRARSRATPALGAAAATATAAAAGFAAVGGPAATVAERVRQLRSSAPGPVRGLLPAPPPVTVRPEPTVAPSPPSAGPLADGVLSRPAAAGLVAGPDGTLRRSLIDVAAGLLAVPPTPGDEPDLPVDPSGAPMAYDQRALRVVRADDPAPTPPDPGAFLDDPAVMHRLVDEVVERIESRVVDELERRGRRYNPGVF